MTINSITNTQCQIGRSRDNVRSSAVEIKLNKEKANPETLKQKAEKIKTQLKNHNVSYKIFEREDM